MTITKAAAIDLIEQLDAEYVGKSFKTKADAVACLESLLKAHKKIVDEDGQLADAPTRSDAVPTEASVTLMVTENPKREGTQSHARFALYKKAKTVGDYLDACVKAGHPRKKARLDIRHDLDKGYISLA